MKTINEDELRFVAKHYKGGRLNTAKAWKKYRTLSGQTERGKMKRFAIAASILFMATMAIACIYWTQNHRIPISHDTEETVPMDTTENMKKINNIKVFRYENQPINYVLKDLSQYYGHKLSANDTTKHLTGELQADSLEVVVDMLEETLDIKISITR